MMHTYMFAGFSPILGTLHAVFALSLLAGTVLLIVWASKNLKKDDLKKLVELLLVIGIVGTLLLSLYFSYAGRGKRMMLRPFGDAPMMQWEQIDNADQAPGDAI